MTEDTAIELLALFTLEEIFEMNNIDAVDILLELYGLGLLTQPEHIVEDDIT